MPADFPVTMKFFTHRGQEGVPPGTGQALRGDHQAGNDWFFRLRLRLNSFSAIDAGLLEPQLEQGSDQQGVKVNGHALFRIAEQMQPVLGAFQKPENQLNLPAIGVQQNNLEGGQVQSVGQDQVLFRADIE